MICLEMIGYFTDEPNSQDYPVPFLRAVYPSVGNFIALASRMEDKAATKKLKTLMKGTSDLPIYSLNAPGIVQGIDYSDHRNYWPHGYPAIMITDSAFYRNHEYHKEGDTYDRLDYDKMGKVTIAVYEAVNGW